MAAAIPALRRRKTPARQILVPLPTRVQQLIIHVRRIPVLPRKTLALLPILAARATLAALSKQRVATDDRKGRACDDLKP